eukprot:GHVN01028824.1.p1 GENE.GHVN01028824.1~~GHVN01028824.1.p1  ORF type:complete len:179 (+),score=19.98 GHVN01028824.1:243-779(+)
MAMLNKIFTVLGMPDDSWRDHSKLKDWQKFLDWRAGYVKSGGVVATTGRQTAYRTRKQVLAESQGEGRERAKWGLRKHFAGINSNPSVVEGVVDLLAMLLDINPKRRCRDAGEALAHPFFSQQPRACSPSLIELSPNASCHEYSLKQERQDTLRIRQQVSAEGGGGACGRELGRDVFC